MFKSSSLCLYSSNMGTFWLKIEQFWPFEEISTFNNGGHFGYRTVLTDTILKGDHPRIISAKLGWYWPSSFREDSFFNFIPLFSIFILPPPILVGSRDHRHILEGDHPRIIPQNFGCNWPSGFWGEDFFKISSPLFSNLHNRSKWVMGFTSKLQGR